MALLRYKVQKAATDPTTSLSETNMIMTAKISSSMWKLNKIKQKSMEVIQANAGKYILSKALLYWF